MRQERYQRFKDVLDNRQPDLVVVMENIWDPHNVSAIMRSCDSVGIQDVYVVLNKVRRMRYGTKSSGSASHWLTVHPFDTATECIYHLKNEGFKVFATHLNEESQSLYQLDLTQKIALVFGNEADGISDEMLQLCDGNFIIPQVGMVKSLNVSVACAVSLFEAFRQKSNANHYNMVNKIPETSRIKIEERWGIYPLPELK